MIGRPREAVIASALALGIAACGEDVVQIELVVVPNGGGDCGLDPGASVVEITALAELGSYSPEFLQTSLGRQELSAFPPDTRQLTMRIRDPGATLVAHGKTPPFVVEDRPAQVPISLFPIEGTCQVGSMASPRRHPTVVAVGDGALVIGGYTVDDLSGEITRVHVIEYFDPFTSSFLSFEPSASVDGFNGGSVATLTDGRVVLTGGEQGYYAVFDPVTRTFAGRPGVFEERALAAVVGLDDHRVLIAGGCADLTVDGTCMSAPLASVKLLDVDAGSVEPLTNLSHPRAGAIAALATDPDGTAVVVIAGGVDVTGTPATDVERVPITGTGVATVTTGTAGGLAAILATGSVLTALAPIGGAPASVATIAVPGQATAHAIAPAPRTRRDAVMVALEDGTVLAIGGVDGPMPDDPAGQMLLYRPTQGWRTVGSVPTPALLDHAAARLADGSVLIVGGRDRDTGAELATAYRYRPPLLGPFAATARVTPALDVDEQLVPLDPDAVDRTDDKFILLATGGLDNYALIAGPQLTEGAMTALVDVGAAGGVGLIARATGPFSFLRAVLVQGQPARLERWADGVSTTACTATSPVPTLGGAVTVTLTLDGDRVVVQRTGAPDPDLDCRFTDDAVQPGLWGIAAVADGARVEVTTISVDR